MSTTDWNPPLPRTFKDMERYVEMNGPPTNECTITWAHQDANVMLYLQKQGLIHRELKLANVLRDAQLMCLLCTGFCYCHNFFLHCVLTNIRAQRYLPVSIALAMQGGAN